MIPLQKYQATLLGLATCDALGTTVEFSPRDTYPHLTDIVGGGPFHLKAGQWTDDTSMALCLAESLIQSNGTNLHDQLNRYTKWWLHGENSPTGTCFDIGNTVRTALENYAATNNPHSGPTHPQSAGNGSIMRLAPIPLYYANHPEEANQAAIQSSLTTHGATESIHACQLLTHLIIQALHGVTKTELLDPKNINKNPSLKNLSSKIQDIIEGTYKTKTRDQIHSTGYVIHSLEAALWSLHTTNTFKEGALTAANLGDDADTVAAIYGQLAGAHYGLTTIPTNWRNIIAWKTKIITLASTLHEKVHLT